MGPRSKPTIDSIQAEVQLGEGNPAEACKLLRSRRALPTHMRESIADVLEVMKKHLPLKKGAKARYGMSVETHIVRRIEEFRIEYQKTEGASRGALKWAYEQFRKEFGWSPMQVESLYRSFQNKHRK